MIACNLPEGSNSIVTPDWLSEHPEPGGAESCVPARALSRLRWDAGRSLVGRLMALGGFLQQGDNEGIQGLSILDRPARELFV